MNTTVRLVSTAARAINCGGINAAGEVLIGSAFCILDQADGPAGMSLHRG